MRAMNRPVTLKNPNRWNNPNRLEPEEKPALPNPATLKSLPNIQPMSCSDPSLSFDDFILAAAKNFEKQKIDYNSIPLSDCSGMFHGRNPSKPAGTTVQKLKNSNKKVPPYGNWTQQWVAVANMATQ